MRHSTTTYNVPDMSCGHCRDAITHELRAVQGVETVDVDLDAKLVVVSGGELDDTAVRKAIEEAGYEVT